MMILEEELAELRSEVEKLRAERDHFREAWAKAQARLDCGVDAANAVREELAAVVAWFHGLSVVTSARSTIDYAADAIERGEHRREEEL